MLSAAHPALPEKPLLLIVADDHLVSELLCQVPWSRFEIITSYTRAHCMTLLRQLRRAPDLVLLDLALPPLAQPPEEGLLLISELAQVAPDARIVALCCQNEEDNARYALAVGTANVLATTRDPGDLATILLGVSLRRIVDSRQGPNPGRYKLDSPLIGESPAIKKLQAQLGHCANLPFPVLIEGESGCGKEIVANYCLHSNTERRDRPFFALNCAAISPSLVEPTLFGYAKGAFTGATSAKSGYFEDAADGTLFLDEIGELPLELQAKLLRVLENGEYQRVGETQKRISRARIVAATNRDLRQEIRAGKFRVDLYHRLSVFAISVPPLREMETDRLLLLDHFRTLYSAQTKQASFCLSVDAQDVWLRYDFPGNVRELRNIAIRLTAKYSGQNVSASELETELDLDQQEEGDSGPTSAEQRLQQREPFYLDHLLGDVEHSYIEAALTLEHGNVSRAARRLGVNRTTLYHRMESAQFKSAASRHNTVL
jgi:two-component system nitrogen regulation response regulator GlnG